MSTNHQQQPVVIGGNVGTLIDGFDILGPMPNTPHTIANIVGQTQQRTPPVVPNLLDDDLSSILAADSNTGGTQTPQPQIASMNPEAAAAAAAASPPALTTTTTTASLPVNQTSKSGNILDDLFGDLNLGGGGSTFSYSNTNSFALPKEVSVQVISPNFKSYSHDVLENLMKCRKVRRLKIIIKKYLLGNLPMCSPLISIKLCLHILHITLVIVLKGFRFLLLP